MKDKELAELKAYVCRMYNGAELKVISVPENISYPNYPFDMNEGALFVSGVIGTTLIVRRIAEDVKDRFNQCALQLRPLSSIEETEAIEVARIAYNTSRDGETIISCVPNADNCHSDIKSVEIQQFINYPPLPKYYKCCHIQIDLVDYDINMLRFTNDGNDIKDDIIGSEEQVMVYQHLQQQSFALPVFFKGVQYSVEDLVSKEIITLLKS